MKKVTAIFLLTTSFASMAGTCKLNNAYLSLFSKRQAGHYPTRPTIFEPRYKEAEVSSWEECFELATQMAKKAPFVRNVNMTIHPSTIKQTPVTINRDVGYNFVQWNYTQSWKLPKEGQVNIHTSQYGSPKPGWYVFDNQGYILNNEPQF